MKVKLLSIMCFFCALPVPKHYHSCICVPSRRGCFNNPLSAAMKDTSTASHERFFDLAPEPLNSSLINCCSLHIKSRIQTLFLVAREGFEPSSPGFPSHPGR